MSEEPSETPGKSLTRKEFVAGSAAVGLGLVLAACNGDDEPKPAKAKSETAPLKDGLAEGMYGGPTGFEGAERYQYPLDSEEGRAIWALRRLRQDGQAPNTLRVVHRYPFIFTEPVIDGAPSHAQVLEEETGVRIEFIESGFIDFVEANRAAAANKDGSFDVVLAVTLGAPDLADAGLLRPLDDFVEEHRPSWLDPVFGYGGGAPVVNRLTKHRGETIIVPWRNHTHVWLYRADLLDDPAEQAAFENAYGRELRFPLTWDEHAEAAEFFHRPDDDPPVYGSIEMKSATYQHQNWAMRFVCSGNPNFFYFNEDGSANVNTEAGRATEEHRRSLGWSEPGALENQPTDNLAVLGSGNAFMTSTNIWMTNVGRREDLPFIDAVKGAVTPGRVIDGDLVRRAMPNSNFVFGVNAFADARRQEAAYLFIQWIAGARVNAWLTFAPSFVEPLHVYALEDPLVGAAYGQQPLTSLAQSMPRSGPTFDVLGGWNYWGALNDEVSEVLLDHQSAEQAMKNLEERWNKTTEEVGVERQIEAIASSKEGFATLVDEPPTS